MNVHQHEIRLPGPGPCDRLCSVFSFAHDLEAFFLFEETGQALSEERVVVSQQHANGFHRILAVPAGAG